MARTTRLRWVALVAGVALVVAGCSSTGGKEAEQSAANAVSAGKADTPKITIAMVTHGAPGDTFWDIIRKGAQAAAAKDNVDLKYSSDPDSGKQATLIQSAIDSKVDGIAVTLPDPPAIAPAVKKAIAAGIPVVAFNAGIGNYAESGRAVVLRLGREPGRADRRHSGRPRTASSTCSASSSTRGRCSSRPAATACKSTFKGKYDKIYVNGSRPAVGEVDDLREAEAGPEHRLRASRWAPRSR